MKLLNTLALGTILGASISAAQSCKVNYVTVTETSTRTVLLSPEEYALRFPPQEKTTQPEATSSVVRQSSYNLSPTPSFTSSFLDQSAGFVYQTSGASTISEGTETTSAVDATTSERTSSTSSSEGTTPTTSSETSTSTTSSSERTTPTTSSEASTSTTSSSERTTPTTSSEASTSTTSSETSTSTTSTSTSSTPTTTSSTTSTSSTSTPTPSSGLSNIDRVMLDRTNEKRALHRDTNPVTWSDELAEYAQRYADSFSCSSTSIAHSGGPYGENLAYGYTAAGAVDAWYNEISDYDYSNPGFSDSTGHFTQLVWASTTQVGCGYKDCSRDGWGLYIACEYSPRGNIINDGYFAANVRPTI